MSVEKVLLSHKATFRTILESLCIKYSENLWVIIHAKKVSNFPRKKYNENN